MAKLGRNDPCPCDSGKKYKQCCQQAQATQASATRDARNAIPDAIQNALEHHQAGRLPQAEAIYQQVLLAVPDHPDALHLLGLIAHQTGNSERAVELINRALRVHPSSSMYCNLGNALLALDRLDAAIESYRNALTLTPNFAEAYNNLGNALRAQGKLDAAFENYRKALSIMPNYPDALNNFGSDLINRGQTDQAIECFHKAITLQANHLDAHLNLASAFFSNGDLSTALEIGKKSLQIEETSKIKGFIAGCIKDLLFTRDDNGEARSLATRAISEPWCRPADLVLASISIIKLNQTIKECVERASTAWPERLSASELYGSSGLMAISNDRLLQCLLENAPNYNLELEQFLTMVRFNLLEAATTTPISTAPQEDVLTFYCALARQCFINEYVFSYTKEEFVRASSLREKLITALATKAQVHVLWVVAVAAYFPLHSLPTVDELLNQVWPDSVTKLLTQQICEPQEEQQYRADIPCLTKVEDDVSRLVQQQYEENPYPRWVKCLPRGKDITFNAYLSQDFPAARFRPLEKNERIELLIAGCGTGQHPIERAQQFRCADILAIDLSLSSLCYAKRKTRESGLDNIEYQQADIMKLGAIDRTFDLIESVGVLHHLADPMAGWRQLLSLLRPGGLMRLGFYSECARQSIVAARRFIAERGFASNAVDIRQCRQELISFENDIRFKPLISIRDFFGTSECRDLLFHVQEHRFTLPQIKECLRELDLDFVGFSLDPRIMKEYEKRFPDDKAKTNLDCWHIFETDNPDTFIGMYQFLVQKKT